MHDPSILAFRVRIPLPRKKRHSKKLDKDFLDERSIDIADIWHVDPEKRGNDDSCGFSVPHLTKAQEERLKNFAWGEAHNPYFLRAYAKHWNVVDGPPKIVSENLEPMPEYEPKFEIDPMFDDYGGSMAEAEALYRGLVLQIANCIGIKMTFEEAAKKAALTIHDPDCVHPADKFCWLPGWHTNRRTDTTQDREEHFYGVIHGIARWMLIPKRPWYRHPRWHVWHWKINVMVISAFKRWAFSRCAGCGKRFPWGYCPVSHQWEGGGPRWFRSERVVYHMECSTKAMDAMAIGGRIENSAGAP